MRIANLWFIVPYTLGCPPLPVTVTNEGLGCDFLLKMVHNPGGDWNPGQGGTTQLIPKTGPWQIW